MRRQLLRIIRGSLPGKDDLIVQDTDLQSVDPTPGPAANDLLQPEHQILGIRIGGIRMVRSGQRLLLGNVVENEQSATLKVPWPLWNEFHMIHGPSMSLKCTPTAPPVNLVLFMELAVLENGIIVNQARSRRMAVFPGCQDGYGEP